jgi:hypothetical protein
MLLGLPPEVLAAVCAQLGLGELARVLAAAAGLPGREELWARAAALALRVLAVRAPDGGAHVTAVTVARLAGELRAGPPAPFVCVLSRFPRGLDPAAPMAGQLPSLWRWVAEMPALLRVHSLGGRGRKLHRVPTCPAARGRRLRAHMLQGWDAAQLGGQLGGQLCRRCFPAEARGPARWQAACALHTGNDSFQLCTDDAGFAAVREAARRFVRGLTRRGGALAGCLAALEAALEDDAAWGCLAHCGKEVAVESRASSVALPPDWAAAARSAGGGAGRSRKCGHR